MIFKSLLRPLSPLKSHARLPSYLPPRIPYGHRNISSRFFPRIFHTTKPNTNSGHHPFRYVTGCIKAMFAAHVYYTYCYSLEAAQGPSMLPTISIQHDWFLIDRAYRCGKGVQVGDIVTFDSVVEPGQKAFKRVLGLEGDCVMIGTPGSGDDQMIRIPEGHCWLVGDNLEWSRDSRMFGPVPMALIKGKIIAKVLPWSESKWFENGLQPLVEDL
ncbi:hypothetical protein MFRU_041g00610 [Monilinia fructicola]|nr:hypothetical protein MFRU_041g00610 [Monilinia fructicola]